VTGPTVEPTERWRELLEQRRDEAVGVLGAVPGVRGLVVGGSMGRGEPWPLSDIDVLAVYAGERGAAELGARLVTLAGADPGGLRRRVEQAPVWLRERIDLAAAARRWVGEPVSAEQNARDQLLAFSVHVARRRPDLAGPWTEPPAPGPDMGERLAELDRLATVIDRQGRPPPPAGGRRA
jgi:predicted nucleotidyltransferase